MKFTSAAIAALGLVSSVSAAAFKKRAATDPIVIKGSKFFHKNSGEQFFMNGVAYQTDLSLVDASDLPAGQQFVDPLTDIESCKRDVPLLEALHTNVIRVYAIDTTKSQDACMKLLSDAGIYVIADLSEPGLSVNRDAPAWDHHLYERYTAVIDKLQKYDNVMGFFAGNEVTNNKSNTDASPFVKASVRDMKAYIKEMKYREIPVGYATNDDEFVRDQLADYFNCGPAEESVDFWGYNIYSWCGQSSLKTSGWDKRTEEYADYNVPVFFAEYGCNEPSPRKFTEVQALYGDEMTPVFSGGIVYMYFQEANNYGLVKVDKSGKATKLSDYNSLESQLESVKPKGVKMSSYTPSNTKARSCPAQSENWKASAELPPKPDQPTCECLRSQLTCIPAANLAEKKYGDIFGYICGQLGEGGCDGIATDGANGVYGSYSMCDAEIRLGWALTQYYESQNSAASACDFDRQARVATPTSLNSTCSKMVDAAGGTAGKALGSTGTKTGENSSSSDKPNAGSCLTPPAGLSTLVVLVASILGMGMIML